MFECTINNFPLMRRCSDNWVNATQILKCCNFPKAKRTKILEKGVQQGLHQKIQGGYGRFQGTWIPLIDAQRLATSYGLPPDAAPVLFFDPSDPSLDIQRKAKEVNKDGTPVKRKYVKKKKPDGTTPKKAKLETGLPLGAPAFPDFNPTDMSRMSSQLSQQYANNPQLPMQFQMNPGFNQQEFAMNNNIIPGVGQNQPMPNDYQNYLLPMQMPPTTQNNTHPSSVQAQALGPQQHPQQQPRFNPQLQFNYPYQQQQQQQQQQQPIAHPYVMGQFHHSKIPSSQSTNETNWSHDENNKDSDTSMSSNEEYKHGKPTEESYSSQLLRFFGEENSTIPYFIHNPPYDFNINEAIDDEGHTPLHWAASIGNYAMIHLLIIKGANPLVVNNYGLNPLSKLVSFNNCYELNNFPEVLDDLELCLINTDINGRTPLHYLCQFSKVSSKYESLRYYLEVILNKLNSLTDNNSNNKSINLIKNVIDHQDVNGDTCLHLCARAGCSKLVKYLLSYDARDDLMNANQETAKYLIMKNDLLVFSNDQSQEPSVSIDPLLQLEQSQGGDISEEQPTPLKHEVSTPTQPSFRNVMETPDTQRTTVQDEDDDEDDHNNARVNKEQLNELMKASHDDSKENVFLDSVKHFDSVSTPIQAEKSNSQLTMSSQRQPLAVISERTAESTPMDQERSPLITKNDIDKPQTYQFNPPELDSEGRIIEDYNKGHRNENENENNETSKEIESKLLNTDDLLSMLGNMVNSLGQSYKGKLKQLNNETLKLEKDLNTKVHMNESIQNKIAISLTKLGIEDFKDSEEVKQLIKQFTSLQDSSLNETENALKNSLEKSQAFDLANLVSTKEENISDNNEKVTDDNKWNMVIELSNLQIQRTKLLSNWTSSIKTYGIDDKMYKYRKLISLSCGLNVEDIDSLIDGIEESLMESSTTKV